jgi:phospholipid/cholesterol/gamma-HCH transport system permease protein
VLLPERLVHETVADLWPRLKKRVARATGTLTCDAAAVRVCDGAGLGMLTLLQGLGQRRGLRVDVVNLQGAPLTLWQQSTSPPDPAPRVRPRRESLVTAIGRSTCHLIQDIHDLIAFVGRLFVTGLYLLTHPQHFRWADFFALLDLVGVRACGLIAVLGLLFGLIMAFSSAMPLRQFGVEIYVADLVAYAMTRVLGPFITAVIVAGRSGSAFAAELGTMKIRNELDALQVMNLDPVRFLVAPRVLASTLMTPLLTMVANVMGILGCAVVILSLGYPLISFWQHVEAILSGSDILIGMIKALVFGNLVGGVGCLRGMQTQSGPGAVGIATTRAVVTAIVLLIITEGVFSVLLYLLNL